MSTFNAKLTQNIKTRKYNFLTPSNEINESLLLYLCSYLILNYITY